MSKVWWLSSEILLKSLPDEDYTRLFQLMHVAPYDANRTVFSSSLPGDVIYCVRQGSLRFIQNTPAGSTRRLATLIKGDMFGSLDLVDQGFRRAQISTETPVQLLVLRKHSYEKLMKFYPAMSARLVTVLKKHLGQNYHHHHELLAKQSRSRILRLLYHTFVHPDYHPEAHTLMACPLREWAELTGSSSEAVELVMESLEEQKIIQIKGNGVRVLEPALLLAQSRP